MDFLRRSLSSGSFGSRGSPGGSRTNTRDKIKEIFTKKIFARDRADNSKKNIIMVFIGRNDSGKTKFISDNITDVQACNSADIVLDVYTKKFRISSASHEIKAQIFDTSLDYSDYCVGEISKAHDRDSASAVIPIIFYDNSAFDPDDFAILLQNYRDVLARADCLFTISDAKNPKNETEILRLFAEYCPGIAQKDPVKHYYLATSYTRPIFSDILEHIG